MRRKSLTDYDEYPEDMLKYLRHNGPHFNRGLYEFAVSKMRMKSNGEEVKVIPFEKEELNKILERYNIKLENNTMYDAAYVACMCKADFLGSSVIDDEHLAMYVKDVIDDIDAPDGLVFNRWYADMCYIGIPIEWEEML